MVLKLTQCRLANAKLWRTKPNDTVYNQATYKNWG